MQRVLGNTVLYIFARYSTVSSAVLRLRCFQLSFSTALPPRYDPKVQKAPLQILYCKRPETSPGALNTYCMMLLGRAFAHAVAVGIV